MSLSAARWRDDLIGSADALVVATSVVGDDIKYVATNAPADTTAYSFQVMTRNNSS
jgi:hypothetical protein